MEYKGGKIRKKKTSHRNARDAKVFIEDHHEGYISLEIFEENQEMIRKNCLSQTQGPRRGAAREGQGLLAGILRCGRCGRKLYVVYHGKSGFFAIWCG